MKIVQLDTILTNAGLRNYLFVRLRTDSGLTGLGEATLEWQERAVQTLIHEWVEERVLGADPFEVESLTTGLIRDQYQGGSTVMTAISSVEIACWDLIGKAEGKPVYELLGGRAHDRLPAYANGWYGGAQSPSAIAGRAREAVSSGYHALKFDPFGIAWQTMSAAELKSAESLVAAVREAVGDDVGIMIEAHGRFDLDTAVEMGRRLEKYGPAWYEEPVTPNSLEQLAHSKAAVKIPIAAGERLYTLEDFERLCSIRAADVVQMDPSHCGGLGISKKIAAMAQSYGLSVSPHCSIGPVALCAALHLDWSTPNVHIQENFSEYDVPWRNELVNGWDPIDLGEFKPPDKPGLGIELNVEACAAHPYQKHSFPSLWDPSWLTGFSQNKIS